MTAPAEEADICPEAHIRGPVDLRIGLSGVAYKTYWFAVYHSYSALLIQHIMGIDR